MADTQAPYDAVAASYADQVRHLLDESPYERAVLELSPAWRTPRRRPLLLGFHVGDESRPKTEGYGGTRILFTRRRPDTQEGPDDEKS
ncbi:hypothetical protein [Streptomyces mirabilis]|uniref:hypothetical protein n=1 Tax=Streptomyces mirabilis TaxID=68239 RepID=UPI0033B086C4